jgi:hypothetical protein
VRAPRSARRIARRPPLLLDQVCRCVRRGNSSTHSALVSTSHPLECIARISRGIPRRWMRAESAARGSRSRANLDPRGHHHSNGIILCRIIFTIDESCLHINRRFGVVCAFPRFISLNGVGRLDARAHTRVSSLQLRSNSRAHTHTRTHARAGDDEHEWRALADERTDDRRAQRIAPPNTRGALAVMDRYVCAVCAAVHISAFDEARACVWMVARS